jgi:hypothetical protein
MLFQVPPLGRGLGGGSASLAMPTQTFANAKEGWGVASLAMPTQASAQGKSPHGQEVGEITTLDPPRTPTRRGTRIFI